MSDGERFFVGSPDLLCILDGAGRIARVNPAFEQALGWSAADVRGRSIQELMLDESRFAPAKRRLAKDHDAAATTLRARFRCRDGSHRSLEWRLSPPDAEGVVYASGRNVGEPDDTARASFHETLLEAVGEAVIATDRTGAITFWNNGAEAIYGWRADEVLGRNIMDITTPETSRAQAEEIIASLAEGCRWSGEFLVRRKDGSSFPALVTDVPLRDAAGELAGVVGVSVDLTEHHRIASALRSSEERYRTLTASAPIGVFQTDASGEVRYVNSYAMRLWGVENDSDVLGQKWIDRVHPEDRGELLSRWAAAAARAGSFEGEYRLLLPDGKVRHVHARAAPLSDHEGKVTGTVGTLLDITERHEVVKELRRQALTFAMINDAVVFTSVAGEVVDWNPAAERTFGYTRSEMLGRQVRDIYVEDVADTQFESVMRSLNTDGRWTGQLRFRRKGGTEGICETSIVLLHDSEGRVIGRLGVNRDVTDRQRGEAALRASEERYRQLVETSHDGICMVDPTGVIDYANERLARMLGLRIEELVNRSIFDFMDSETAFTERNRFARRQRGISETDELPLRRVDGSVIWVSRSASSTLAADGSLVGTVFMLDDITERHAARRRLAESERHFRALTEQSSELVSVVDAQGVIRYGNAAYSRLLGYEPEEVLGLPVLQFVHPDDAPSVAQLFDRVVREPGAVVTSEYRARHREGGWRTFRTVGQNLLADPAIRGIVVNSYDITAAKEIEELERRQRELLASIFDHIPAMIALTDRSGVPLFVNREWMQVSGWSIDELHPEVDLWAELYPEPEERRRVLEFMRAGSGRPGSFRMKVRDGRVLDTVWASVALSDGTYLGMGQNVTEQRRLEEQLGQSQKLEAIGRLAGGVAHDFNNMLMVITSYATLVQQELPVDDPLRADLDEIRTAADRAASLTRQLLAFSRQQVLEPKVVDLREVLRETERMLRRLIGEDVELSITGSESPALIMADPGQIVQVIMNLSVNARDAMPGGGVLSMAVDTKVVTRGDIDFNAGIAEGDYVTLTIRDTGEGMDAATQARIFEPFFTTKVAGKGTGLGLPTVYGIVTQSGGHIDVESSPGAGATFTIHLPRVEDVLEAESFAPAPAMAERRAATILVVEDEASLRAVVRRVLEQRGYTVLLAVDGADALRIAEEHRGPIHALVTDVVMPRLGGLDLASRLVERRGELPVLFMTGYATEAVAERGVLRPGSRLLKKPFSPQDLALAVSEMLQPHAA